MKVLIVDDSKTMIRIIKNTVERIGLTDIETAENGVEALEIFDKGGIDVLLTDWNMPEMNGLELIQEVRKRNDDVHIIMITTEGAKANVITALKAGANNYIVKPFTPQVLKDKLSSILSSF